MKEGGLDKEVSCMTSRLLDISSTSGNRDCISNLICVRHNDHNDLEFLSSICHKNKWFFYHTAGMS